MSIKKPKNLGFDIGTPEPTKPPQPSKKPGQTQSLLQTLSANKIITGTIAAIVFAAGFAVRNFYLKPSAPITSAPQPKENLTFKASSTYEINNYQQLPDFAARAEIERLIKANPTILSCKEIFTKTAFQFHETQTHISEQTDQETSITAEIRKQIDIVNHNEKYLKRFNEHLIHSLKHRFEVKTLTDTPIIELYQKVDNISDPVMRTNFLNFIHKSLLLFEAKTQLLNKIEQNYKEMKEKGAFQKPEYKIAKAPDWKNPKSISIEVRTDSLKPNQRYLGIFIRSIWFNPTSQENLGAKSRHIIAKHIDISNKGSETHRIDIPIHPSSEIKPEDQKKFILLSTEIIALPATSSRDVAEKLASIIMDIGHLGDYANPKNVVTNPETRNLKPEFRKAVGTFLSDPKRHRETGWIFRKNTSNSAINFNNHENQ